ncbi:cysteine hydrolase [Pseudomonas sp. MWU13-2860]|nr:cysteine hydrolase [Pseudomonas sp. MWU13-2860]
MKLQKSAFEDLSSTIPGVDFSDLNATALMVVDVQHSDATPGRGWVKACEAVAPLPDETIIRKTTQGAFNGSEIHNTLERMGIKNLVFTGVVTSCCVETTARDAADRGFGYVLVSDGCADADPGMHNAAMLNFGLYFGKVVQSAEELTGPLMAAVTSS